MPAHWATLWLSIGHTGQTTPSPTTTPILCPPQTLVGESDSHSDHSILASLILVPSSSPHVKITSTPTPDITRTADTTQQQTQASRSMDATPDSTVFGWTPLLA